MLPLAHPINESSLYLGSTLKLWVAARRLLPPLQLRYYPAWPAPTGHHVL